MPIVWIRCQPERLREGLAIAQRYELRWTSAWLGAFLGFALTLAGEMDEAADDLHRAVDIARREGLAPFLAWSLVELAGAVGPGSPEGRAALEEANEMMRRMGLRRRRVPGKV